MMSVTIYWSLMENCDLCHGRARSARLPFKERDRVKSEFIAGSISANPVIV